MAEQRRSLTEGIQELPTVDRNVEKAFVRGDAPAKTQNGTTTTTTAVKRVHFSTRIRDDYFKALKRASLERQIDGIEPSTIVEILEQALGPWLESNGYLS